MPLWRSARPPTPTTLLGTPSAQLKLETWVSSLASLSASPDVQLSRELNIYPYHPSDHSYYSLLCFLLVWLAKDKTKCQKISTFFILQNHSLRLYDCLSDLKHKEDLLKRPVFPLPMGQTASSSTSHREPFGGPPTNLWLMLEALMTLTEILHIFHSVPCLVVLAYADISVYILLLLWSPQNIRTPPLYWLFIGQ